MDMEQRDGKWRATVEITADKQADLIKRVSAVHRLMKKMDKEPQKPRRDRGEGTLYKRNRDGMWVGQVELARGPDGKRRKSKPVYSADKATAVAKLNELKERIAKGLEEANQRLTVEAYLEKWVAEVAPTKVGPNAIRSYKSAINTRIVPAIGTRRLAELSPDDIRYMHRWILSHTYKRGKVKKPYTTRSVEEAHNVLSGALADALSDGKVWRNVCTLVAKPTVTSESHGALTAEQARKVLLSSMAAKDPMVTRWAAGLMLGGRQGELLGLEWERVDLDAGVVDLSWQLQWLKLKPGAKPDDPKRFDVRADFELRPLWRGAAWTRPKTKTSERLIPIPAPLVLILTEYRKIAPANPWGLVWVTLPGEKSRIKHARPVNKTDDNAAWKAAQARAGVEVPLDVHAMRGTTATLLMESKVPDKVIQAVLGHSNVVMTRRYQQVNLEEARKSLGSLDALLAPSKE